MPVESVAAAAEAQRRILGSGQVVATEESVQRASSEGHSFDVPTRAAQGQTDQDDGTALATLELARRLTMLEMEPVSLEALEDAVHRLARAYSTTPPAQLIPQVQTRLTQVDDLLQRRVTLHQHTRLLTAAGWLHLLLAALHFDLGQHEPAHISRDAALYLGQEAHDSDIAGWAWETPSWFSLTEGRPYDAIEFAEQGRSVASRGSSAHVQNTMKIAIAQAQLGDRARAERALDEATAEVAAMPTPEHPDHHFVFDPPKLSHYASQVYAWLNVPELVEEHAREVLRQSVNPRWRTWVPSRVANVRLDLAQTLLTQGRLDEALDEGLRALDSLIRHDTLVRAAHVNATFVDRYPTARESRDFRERLRMAQSTLYVS
jgi:tetratricopeptide (TPR) repeat protein